MRAKKLLLTFGVLTALTVNSAAGAGVRAQEGDYLDLSHLSDAEAVTYTIRKTVQDVFPQEAREDFYNLDPGVRYDLKSISAGLPKLQEYKVEEGNTWLNAQDGMLYVTASKELVACPLQKSGKATVAEGTLKIGKESLLGNKNITELTIPASVEEISRAALGDNDSLTDIVVSPENKNYTAKDGVLYTSDMKTLVCYPAGKKDTSFTLPASVTTIYAGAFMGAKNLQTVDLSGGVLQDIDCSAFAEMDELKTVKTGENLRAIAGGAFQKCGNLSSVTLKEGLVYLYESCFGEDKNLKKITIPASVVYLQDALNEADGTGKTITVTKLSAAYDDLQSRSKANTKAWKNLNWTIKVKKTGRTVPKIKKTKLSAGTGKAVTTWYKKGKKKLFIRNADELAGLAKLVNQGKSMKGKTIILKKNIDLAKYKNWNSIGNHKNKKAADFKGVFDGKGHTIYNLRKTAVNYSGYDEGGLFYLTGKQSVVKNVVLKNVYVLGVGYIGAVAGGNNGTIQNCKVYGQVEAVAHAGGITGGNDGQIKNCVSNIKVYAGQYAGGIAGNSDFGKITNSKNKGTVHASAYAGGIVGGVTVSEVITGCSSNDNVYAYVAKGKIAPEAYYGKGSIKG